MSDDTNTTTPQNKPRGRPFQKGFDSNRSTGGRVTRAENGKAITLLCREFGEEGLEVLKAIARNPESKDADRIKAVKTVLDRGFGTAQQNIAVHKTSEQEVIHHSINLDAIPVETQIALLAAIEQQEAIEGQIITREGE